LDEIHGFSVPTEILAMQVRKLLLKNNKKLKLILMSATLDPEILQYYFREISEDIPLISVE
jgi:HrpA-like RNA helicase